MEDIATGISALAYPGVPYDNQVVLFYSDIEGDELTARVVESTTENGTLSFSPDGSFTYAPTADFNGLYSFTYEANDGTDDSFLGATVSITVNPVNDEPVAADDSGTTDHETLVNCPSGAMHELNPHSVSDLTTFAIHNKLMAS